MNYKFQETSRLESLVNSVYDIIGTTEKEVEVDVHGQLYSV